MVLCTHTSSESSYSEDDLEVMGLTVWSEARGESPAAMQGVAWTIVNRLRDASNRWPKSPAAVCRQRGQYSWWHDQHLGAISRDTPTAAAAASGGFSGGAAPAPSARELDTAKGISRQSLTGQLADNVGGAQHVFAVDMPLPAWAQGFTLTTTIGHFRFYRS
jgi:spore germination cell wall hydrolase CwlJ-like protein